MYDVKRSIMGEISQYPAPTLTFPDNLPVFQLNADGKVSYWNQACEEITGITADSVMGTDEHWRSFYTRPKRLFADILLSGGDMARRYDEGDAFGTMKMQGDAASCLMSIDRALNGDHMIWTQAAVLRNAEGAAVGAWQAFQTITLTQLAACSPIVKTFVDKFPLPVSLVINEKIYATNTAYAKLTGYSSPEEMVGIHVSQFIDESDINRFLSLNNNNHAGLVSGSVYRWKYRVHGQIRHVEGRPTVFSWGNDTILISTVIDITDLVHREEHLEKEKRRLESENKQLLAKIRGQAGVCVGESLAMQQTMARALQMAKTDTNLVILGETGTGKSMLARVIHDMSGRSAHPFVVVNCAAIPEQLLESEFFGHVKGAFTGALSNKIGYLGAANRGTLFLDEVGELSTSMQAKLLHAIERKKYMPVGDSREFDSNVRLICATNRNLLQMVREGTLREDFFYRIFVGDISIPSLRERKEDLPKLVEFFFEKFSTTDTPSRIPDKLMKAFGAYSWPGNVRELQNVILRYLATGEIHFFSTPKDTRQALRDGPFDFAEESGGDNVNLAQCIETAERGCIEKALQLSGGRKDRAAKLLGINLRTFHRRCARLGILGRHAQQA